MRCQIDNGKKFRLLEEIYKKQKLWAVGSDIKKINELVKKNLYSKIWQAYAALLPIRTVGVMGDSRTYENICLLRAVTSEDGMSADYFSFPKDFK